MAEAKTVKKAPRKRARKTTKTKAKPIAKPATKSAVKKAPKKTAKKAAKRTSKRTSKRTAKAGKKLEIYKLAKPANGERYFILANGKPIRHVAHLAEVLEDLEEHVFDHHVNPDKNDFATWVQDVFEDIELAKKMLGVKSKEKLQLVIYKHAAHKAFAHKG